MSGGVFGKMSGGAMDEDSAPPADEATPETEAAAEITPFGTDGLPDGEPGSKARQHLTICILHYTLHACEYSPAQTSYPTQMSSRSLLVRSRPRCASCSQRP